MLPVVTIGGGLTPKGSRAVDGRLSGTFGASISLMSVEEPFKAKGPRGMLLEFFRLKILKEYL
jgi:hypothetical protein